MKKDSIDSIDWVPIYIAVPVGMVRTWRRLTGTWVVNSGKNFINEPKQRMSTLYRVIK